MKKHRLIQLIIDPSSGELSMSRLCLGLLIILYIPALAVLEGLGVKLGLWAHLAVIVGSVCGVYGINTGLRVWRGRVIEGPPKPGG